MANRAHVGSAAGLVALGIACIKYLTKSADKATVAISEPLTSITTVWQLVMPTLVPAAAAVVRDPEPFFGGEYVSPAATFATPLNWLFVLLLFFAWPGFTGLLTVGGRTLSTAISQAMVAGLNLVPRRHQIITRDLWKCYSTAECIARLVAGIFFPGHEISPVASVVLAVALYLCTDFKWPSKADDDAIEDAAQQSARISELEAKLKNQTEAANAFDVELSTKRSQLATVRRWLAALRDEKTIMVRDHDSMLLRISHLEKKNAKTVALTEDKRALLTREKDLVRQIERLNSEALKSRKQTEHQEGLLRKHELDKVKDAQIRIDGHDELERRANSAETECHRNSQVLANLHESNRAQARTHQEVVAASEKKLVAALERNDHLDRQLDILVRGGIDTKKEKAALEAGIEVNKALRKQIKDLKTSEAAAKLENDKLTKAKAYYMEEVRKLKKANATMKKDKDAIDQEKNELSQLYDGLAEEMSDLSDKRDALAKERKKISENYDDLAGQHDQLVDEYDDLERDFERFDKEKACEKVKLENKIAALEDGKAEQEATYEETIKDLKKGVAEEKASLEETIKTLENGTAKVLKHYDILEDQSFIVQKKLRNLQRKYFIGQREYHVVQQDYNKLEKSARTMSVAFGDLRRKHTALSEKSAHDERNLSALRRQKKDLEKALRKACEETVSVGRVFDRREANYERIIDESYERIETMSALASALQDEVTTMTESRDEWYDATMHFRGRILKHKKAGGTNKT